MTQIISKAVHVDMTDSLQNTVEAAFSQVLESFENLVVENITVTLESRPNQSTNKSKVTARVPVVGNDVVVTQEGDDMYQVINSTADVVLRQMRRIKTRSSKKGSDSIRHAEQPLEESEE